MGTTSLSCYFSYNIILKSMNNMCGGIRIVLWEAYVSAHLNTAAKNLKSEAILPNEF
jgi:hypothetical protein